MNDMATKAWRMLVQRRTSAWRHLIALVVDLFVGRRRRRPDRVALVFTVHAIGASVVAGGDVGIEFERQRTMMPLEVGDFICRCLYDAWILPCPDLCCER